MMLLGVLFAQVWHWYTWTNKERKFIRIIVVSPQALESGDVERADNTVLGLTPFHPLEHFRYCMDIPPLC
jgi:hypothetical protein